MGFDCYWPFGGSNMQRVTLSLIKLSPLLVMILRRSVTAILANDDDNLSYYNLHERTAIVRCRIGSSQTTYNTAVCITIKLSQH